MELRDVAAIVGDTPNMRLEQALRLERLVEEFGLKDCLELGFAHGVGTCYLAALASRSGGRVTAVDLVAAKQRVPSAETLLAKTGLADHVTLHHEPTSYTWRLMRMLEQSPQPTFDLCYLDGAHNWFVDGFAFFLVDRLLSPGGWIVFDDLDWTYAGSPTVGSSDLVASMPEDERTTPQVRRVFDLLVKQHQSYESFRVEGDWGFARKRVDVDLPPREVATETTVIVNEVGLGAAAKSAWRRLRRSR
jgi:predicted O-methyltransferase YrrM